MLRSTAEPLNLSQVVIRTFSNLTLISESINQSINRDNHNITGDEGIVGLCKGAKVTLVIPPEMGYGASGAGGDIPGGASVSDQ